MTDSSKESVTHRKVWNSLEFCKLASTVLTPLTVFILGCVIWNGQRDIVQRWEHDQVEQRKATEADTRERDLIRGDSHWRTVERIAPVVPKSPKRY